MLRSGTNEQEWNGVWIVCLLSKELKEDLISLSRNSDPVMTIELGLEDNNGRNNGRNGSCLTWMATSLEEKRRWLVINASPRGQYS